MKKQKTIFLVTLFVCLLLFSSNTYAACVEGGIRCEGKLERLYMHTGVQKLFIAIDGDESVLDCASQEGVFLTLPTNHSEFKNLYAMLLTALSLDSPVGLRMIQGSAGCEVLYGYLDNTL